MKIQNPATGARHRHGHDGQREGGAREVRARARRAAALGRAPDGEAARGDPRVPRAGRGAQPTCSRARCREEVGKPIRQSRNELNGLTGRLDFFLAESARALRDEKVFAERGAEAGGADHARAARRDRQHLGVELPVLRRQQRVRAGAGRRQRGALQAVGVRDADRACTSPRCCRRPACPRTCSCPSIGDGATGAALLRQPVDGVFFTGSYATGAKIAASAGRRMIKVQLELGGKDPIYVADDVDVKAAAAAVADGAFYNTGQSCCSVERDLRARVGPRRVRRRVRGRGQGLQARRPAGRSDLHRRHHAQAAARGAEAAGRRRREERREAAPRRRRRSGARATGSRRRC